MPKLDEVKAKVRDEVLKKKAIDVGAPARGGRRRADEVGRLQRGREGGGPRGEDDRLHRARRADRRRRRQPRRRRGRVRAAAPAASATRSSPTTGAVIVKVLEKRREDRPPRRQGRSRSRRHEGHAEDRAAQRAPQPLLRVVHDQGARADEGQHQPRAHRAAGGVEFSRSDEFPVAS